MSSSEVNLEKYRIPLEEIIHATNNFSFDTLIGDGGFGMVYKGQLSKHSQNHIVAIKRLNQDGYQGNNEFLHELEMVSSFHHPNIISFIGYYNDANEMILVYEYAANGSLDHHLQNPNKRRCMTWAQRLKICLGVARGLKYLHSGLGEHMRVIHRDMKSANILLDENLDAKICDFGLSRFGPRNQPDSEVLLTKASGTRFYIDPIYNERGRLWKESDVYSFGVVLFEMSSGMLAYAKCFGETKEQYLMDLVRSYYEDDQKDDELEKFIDPILKGHVDMKSFRMFNEIAYECVNLSLKERPTMERIIRKIEQAMDLQNNYATSSITTRNLESFRIPLNKINLATENFKANTCIGGGRFYAMYIGKLSNQWENRLVAIKRLKQGEHEYFHNELHIILSFHHQNIIPFIGYCDEGNEMIIVYEYATNGSVNDHIKDPNKRSSLTWAQRLKICIGAARGLEYLHSGLGEDNDVVHGNFKSENVLLDKNFEAKICDFHFSIQGPINKPSIRHNKKPVDIEFYMNPIFEESIFHKEADVYSLGMILVEMFSGRLANEPSSLGDDKPQYLGDLFIRNYSELDRLIDPLIRDQINSTCYEAFTEIAYECITFYGFGGCPTMETIIEMLEAAADFQGIEV
ncbi:serine/threonine-protein kinase PCRK1 [Lactuca sativa]|nr:serine/threonine-protein kinase PCRK1 [Lactuca sativa]